MQPAIPVTRSPGSQLLYFAIRMARPLLITPDVQGRQHERIEFFRKVRWDFYTASSGPKTGYVTNLSKTGCLMKSNELIDHRRWIRIMLIEEDSNVTYTAVGRIVRCENVLEAVTEDDVTLYRFGIEFTRPNYFACLILDFSKRNLTVRSCRNLNTKSSLRLGFLS